ncbi:MAG: SRPBCC family protein [Acidobacteriota bacterium]|nr:SRPBCC family protein [Acidobacteriota bacterium]
MNQVLSESVDIHLAPADVYDMIADVTRMGEWSPVCVACWWDEGDGPREGSWFTGRNETPERTWETRSLVTVARRGEEFTFVVAGVRTRWSYTLEEIPGGSRLTETWEFLPGGEESFRERFGDDAENQLSLRREAARSGIPATLAAIKTAAENGPRGH